MIIAHLPAGYIFARAAGTKGAVMGAILLASILPDFDMLWFYLVDNKAVHHHYYYPHIPAIWLAIAAIILPVIYFLKKHWLKPAILCFCVIFIHLILDSLVGSIMWLWPHSNQFYQLATVPATQSHWVLSFMLHWNFAAEIAICVVALVLYFKRPRQ